MAELHTSEVEGVRQSEERIAVDNRRLVDKDYNQVEQQAALVAEQREADGDIVVVVAAAAAAAASATESRNHNSRTARFVPAVVAGVAAA